MIFVCNLTVGILGAADVALYSFDQFANDLASGNLKVQVKITANYGMAANSDYIYLRSIRDQEEPGGVVMAIESGQTYTFDLFDYFVYDNQFYVYSPYYLQLPSDFRGGLFLTFDVYHAFQLKIADTYFSVSGPSIAAQKFGGAASTQNDFIMRAARGFYSSSEAWADMTSTSFITSYSTVDFHISDYYFNTWNNYRSLSVAPVSVWLSNGFEQSIIGSSQSFFLQPRTVSLSVPDDSVYGLRYQWAFPYSNISNDVVMANSIPECIPFLLLVPRFSYYVDSFVSVPGIGGGSGNYPDPDEPTIPGDSNTSGSSNFPSESQDALDSLQGILDDMEKADVPPLEDFDDSLVDSNGMAEVFQILSPITSLPVFGIAFSMFFGLIAAKLLLFGVR